MKRIICALAVTALFGPLTAMAQEKPTPEEARKVINYYFNGKGQGVIPMAYKLCKEISQKGEMKNAGPITRSSIRSLRRRRPAFSPA